jgi:CheY-like chemotaxis protein/tRNA A-37 threonylcarbamoyl transferase component Bud32
MSRAEMRAKDLSDRYQIEDEIGRGSIGVVHRGVDLALGRAVAIKRMRPELVPHERQRTRFLREAELCGRLGHPNIVPLYDVGDIEGRPALVMALLAGRSLRTIVRSAQVPIGRLLGWFGQVCNGLAFAHAQGVIHRDVKPAHIFVGDFGQVVLTDWGLAKALRAPSAPVVPDAPELSAFSRESVTRVGERIRLVVKDTGPGIALEHQERIFEAFQQGDVGIQRRFGGTGLGLAITQRIVRLMGGEVTLRSAPGEGSEFALDVPLPSVTHTAPAPSMRSLPEPRSLRVLLAEDDPVNASMTAALLSKLGHQVKVVSNGRECVEEMGGGDHELILMDVHMPEIDGLQATQLIRQREKEGDGKQHVPIVALTADAMKGDDLRCLSAGMDAYLAKPVTVAALKDLLMWFGSQP